MASFDLLGLQAGALFGIQIHGRIYLSAGWQDKAQSPADSPPCQGSCVDQSLPIAVVVTGKLRCATNLLEASFRRIVQTQPEVITLLLEAAPVPPAQSARERTDKGSEAQSPPASASNRAAALRSQPKANMHSYIKRAARDQPAEPPPPTRNNQERTDNKLQTTNYKQQTTNYTQQTTNNKLQTTNNKQQT